MIRHTHANESIVKALFFPFFLSRFLTFLHRYITSQSKITTCNPTIWIMFSVTWQDFLTKIGAHLSPQALPFRNKFFVPYFLKPA